MMNTVRLVRLEEDYVYGTFGVLIVGGELFCYTLEPRDEENQENASSIPAQQYTCALGPTQSYGDTYKVLNVPGRSDILFHPGNIVENTKGCILLGSEIGKFRGSRAILNSGRTFNSFLYVTGKKPFQLTIVECY